MLDIGRPGGIIRAAGQTSRQGQGRAAIGLINGLAECLLEKWGILVLGRTHGPGDGRVGRISVSEEVVQALKALPRAFPPRIGLYLPLIEG